MICATQWKLTPLKTDLRMSSYGSPWIYRGRQCNACGLRWLDTVVDHIWT